jgi:hypothetical protein
VSLSAINGAVLLDHQDLHIDYNDPKKFALGENLPGFDTLRCTVAASPGKVEGGAGFRISSTLKDYRVGPEKSQVMLCEGKQKFRVESEQKKRSQKRMNSRIHLRKFHAAAASIRLS